ncbi:RsbT co-antagonist protein RsbRA [Listeria fleischmannii]|jgi:rsbT co-antagonist protein RsbR|uniref:Regulator of sigma-B activity n=1 Tax=Listeria fleischmannii FSL S10-1203 TaxID=1265822 RepID=W7DPZ5_9LIST|nr:RsbT co-antagonist protein RsbRA [Listeria fleischmannii]EUJ51840.1 regulator of sigma-B activity [Listeria fleischmannii FSL S10-1203]MBC1417426.1 STAS domain-containing protein [Listeria fleischmannii]
MYKDFANFIRSNREDLLVEWMKEMEQQADSRISDIVTEIMYEETSHEFIDLIISNVTEAGITFNEKLDDFAEKVVLLGWPVHFVTSGLRIFGLLVYKAIRNEAFFVKKEVEAENDAYYRFESWLSSMYNKIVTAYADTWEKTVSIQKLALQELSAPLLPIFDHISVMPLIGTIDTERARQIMENLLMGVVKHRSEVVLIDITGVPVVDTMVAHHIIQASEAVRLVGCQPMLVGIRPEIAQTIVNLGIELDKIITTNTLKKGMERALALTNREIVEKEG